MLNRIFRDVNDIGIVIIDGKMFLTNTIIKAEFLVQQLPAAMYSALAVDNKMEFCFLLIHETRLLPT